jgi:hypothetical protein
MSSSKKETKQEFKLRLIAWDKNSKAEVSAAGYATTLDLTLKAKKNWSSVVQHLSRKWANINNIGNRLQIFSVDTTTQQPSQNYLVSNESVTVGNSLNTHPALSQKAKPGVIPTIQLFYHLPIPQQTHLLGGQSFLPHAYAGNAIPAEILYGQLYSGIAPQSHNIYANGTTPHDTKPHTVNTLNPAATLRSSLHTMPLLLSSGLAPAPINVHAPVGVRVLDGYGEPPPANFSTNTGDNDGVMIGDETMACLAEFDGATLPHASPEGGPIESSRPDKGGDFIYPSERSLVCFSDSIAHFLEEFAQTDDGGGNESSAAAAASNGAVCCGEKDPDTSSHSTGETALGKRSHEKHVDKKHVEVAPKQEQQKDKEASGGSCVSRTSPSSVAEKTDAPKVAVASPSLENKRQRMEPDANIPFQDTDHEGETTREYIPPSTPPKRTHHHHHHHQQQQQQQQQSIVQEPMEVSGRTPPETEMVVHSESSCQSVSPSKVHERPKQSGSEGCASFKGNTIYGGIPRSILMPNKRKPHLKRITPTFVSKLSGQK